MAPANGRRASVSEDDDWEDDYPPATRRIGHKSKATTSRRKTHSKKRTIISDDDFDEDSDSISSALEESEEEEVVSPQQLNARGSQRRKAAPTNGTYLEKDGSDDEAFDPSDEHLDEGELDDEVLATIEEDSPPDIQLNGEEHIDEEQQPSKVIRLPINTRRVTRHQVAMEGIGPQHIKLSNSGRHAHMVDVERGSKRPASKQPAGKKPASKRLKVSDSEDFKPDEEDDTSNDEISSPPRSRKRTTQTQDESPSSRPRTRGFSEQEEVAEELEELGVRSRKRIRPPPPATNRVKRDLPIPNYAIPHPDDVEQQESERESPSRRAPVAPWKRTLFPTAGVFGGALPSVLGGTNALAEIDDDSSDDSASEPEMTVSGQAIPSTADKAPSKKSSNVGKLKDKKILTQADPLGVDLNVDFDSVGGLENHILQLKEMLALPLLYPEIFAKFNITPPRGALFHGPPGTGKTLVARALSNSISNEGHEVTFYMRKGADLLSKWVGEGERQLVQLFDEAKKTAPSIIFFDEIDGIAPPRSGKSEQSHTTSLVSTLLSLMDGLDGRGQVIVIGATNRPDAVDAALRRPGRFDREFYFPLPASEARRAILEIHTKGWNPPLAEETKSEIVQLTKGYGGADIRSLCMEAALTSVQRRYPQIYKSTKKLVVDPATIAVLPADFISATKKILPSSARETPTGTSALPKSVEPLLRNSLNRVESILKDVLPQTKPLTTLQAAEYEEDTRREKKLEEFDRARMYRPRLLIRGGKGMGQNYLAAAILNGLEGLHIQSLDLPTLARTGNSLEIAVVNSIEEVRKHPKGLIFISDMQAWCETVGPAVVKVLITMMQTIPSTDPVLLLGFLESTGDGLDPEIISALFGSSKNNIFDIDSPSDAERHAYFAKIISYIMTPPSDFPEATRKKRQLEELPLAPPPPPKEDAPLTKQELKAKKKAQKKADRTILHLLKQRLAYTMSQAKKARKFRTGVIEEAKIRYLYDEADPDIVTGDVHVAEDRPYERATDKNGAPGLREVSTGKFYYNMDLSLIEKRLANGFYVRFVDFLADFKKIAKDARVLGDEERIIRANELLATVEYDIIQIEQTDQLIIMQTDQLYARILARTAEKEAAQEGAGTPSRAATAPDAPDAAPDALDVALDAQDAAQDAQDAAQDAPEAPDAPDASLDAALDTAQANAANRANSPVPAQNVVMSGALEDTTQEMEETIVSNPAQNILSNGSGITGPDLTVYPDRGEHEDYLPDTQQGTQHGSMILDSEVVDEFHQALTEKSRGLSIEQLEHISSAIFGFLWGKRGDWDRTSVCKGGLVLLDEVLGETLPLY